MAVFRHRLLQLTSSVEMFRPLLFYTSSQLEMHPDRFNESQICQAKATVSRRPETYASKHDVGLIFIWGNKLTTNE